ncbi:MAG: hypothetical protein Roseis2KO_57260 [Roseivirga sp.]
MPELQVFDNIEDMKASDNHMPAISMEEALIRVLDLMDLYASLAQPRPSSPGEDDGINWVELKWPAND